MLRLPFRAAVALALLVAMLAASVLLAAAAVGAATTARPGPARLRLKLDEPPLPTSLRVGQLIRISGHVRYAGRSVAVLQGRKTTGPWRDLARFSLPQGGGSFRIGWRVSAGFSFEPLSLRLAILVRGRVAAATIPVHSIVGPAAIKCIPPAPPAVDIPVGDGWIVGGAYIRGGPYPGLDECESQTYTVTATDTSTGAAAATQTVTGGHSYTLVLPAGSYTLRAGGCTTAAAVTVQAATQTVADAYCDVP